MHFVPTSSVSRSEVGSVVFTLVLLLLRRLIRTEHKFRPDLLVKFFRCEEAKLDSRVLQCEALLVGLLGSLGDIVVSQVRVKNGSKHERLVEELADAVLVRLNAHNAILGEAPGAIGEQPDRLEEVLDEDRLEDVQLELAVATCDANGGVVAHDLRSDHSERLALRRVDLAWHDRATRLVLGKRKLAKAAARAGTKVSNVISNLHEADCDSVERAARLDDSVVRCKCLKLVGRSLEGDASDVADLGGDLGVETLVCVQAGTDGCTTLCEHAETREHALDALDAVFHLFHVAAELLTKGQGCCILQMRPSNLDDVFKLFSFRFERLMELFERGKEGISNLHDRGDVHGSREGVVRGLGHVDVVVRMNRLFRAELPAENLNGAVRDHFVHVHVGLRARASLEDDQREVVVQLASNDLERKESARLMPSRESITHLISSLADCISNLLVQAVCLVDGSSRLLEHTESFNQRSGHAFLRAANVKVLQRSLRLRAPVLVGGHFQVAESVSFGAEFLSRLEETDGARSAGCGGQHMEEVLTILGVTERERTPLARAIGAARAREAV